MRGQRRLIDEPTEAEVEASTFPTIAVPVSVGTDPAPPDRDTAGRGSPAVSYRLRAHLRDPLFRNGYALICNTVLTSLLGTGYWILAARHYSTEDVGRASAAISTMVLLSGIAQLNLGPALTRFLPRAGARSVRLILGAYGASMVAAALTSFSFLVFFHNNPTVRGFIGKSAPLMAWFFVSVVAWGVFALQDFVLSALREATWVAVENALYGIAKMGLLVAFAVEPGLGIFASWTIPVVISLFPVNALIFRRLVPRQVERMGSQSYGLRPREIGRFVALDYLGSLFLLGTRTLLPIVIVARVGASANGYFYVAWVILTALELVGTNLGTSLTVEGAIDESKLREFAGSVAKRTFSLIVPAAGVIFLFAPTVLTLFGSAYAVKGTALLRLLAVSVIPRSVTSLYASVARVQRRPGRIALAQGAMFVLVVGLSALFVGSLGINGVGVGYLLSQVVLAAFLIPSLLRVGSGGTGSDPDLPAPVGGASLADQEPRPRGPDGI